MTPVDMAILDHGKPGSEFGDCFRACVATVMNLPGDQVPHFCRRPHPASRWVMRLNDWLSPRGLVYMAISGAPDWCWIRHWPVMVIAGGKSPRGDFDHAVVGRVSRSGFEMLHDPHPSRAGLVGDPDDYGMFVRTWLPPEPDSIDRLGRPEAP
jgi:hypothetical protein